MDVREIGQFMQLQLSEGLEVLDRKTCFKPVHTSIIPSGDGHWRC